jgi:hypothetical protein
MRLFLATFMILHGFAHMVGFAGALGLSTEIPYKTTIMSGRVEVGDTGMRFMSVLWLLAALAFVLVGLSAWANQSWWMDAALGVAAASLMLCMAELPDARIGMAINTIILIGVIGAHRTGWV